MKRDILACAIFSLISTGLAVRTDAEVRVRVRADGEYDSTLIIPGGARWRQGIWSTRARLGLRRESAVLNPLGDRFGDLMPSIGENTGAPFHPLAVWSRFNGNDYDLVFAAWRYGWSAISRVTSESLSGDDLNPNVAFSNAGRPLVAWWNRDLEDGHGTVYYSVFGRRGWVVPIKISADSVGGRQPTIEIGNGTIVIHYMSDDGSEEISYQVTHLDPATITGDIDPQGSLGGDTPTEVDQN